MNDERFDTPVPPDPAAFEGFPGHGARYTAVPDLFFARLLGVIEDPAELRALLFVFWRARGKRSDRQYVTRRELVELPAVLGAFGSTVEAAQAALGEALEACVRRGTLIEVVVGVGEGVEHVFFVNAPADAERARKLRLGELPLLQPPRRLVSLPPRRSRAAALLEARLGLLTPELARMLARAERRSGEEPVVRLIEDAAAHAERPWSYVRAGLERLALGSEGEVHEEPA